MATPLVKKRFNLGDNRVFLEMLPTPDIFLDGDYNSNTELIWDYFSTFIEQTFGTVRTNGFDVTINSDDIYITSGTIWHNRFYVGLDQDLQLTNKRVAGSTQFLYIKITYKRNTIEDDPVSEEDSNLADIRQNINGSDVSRPNQYVYNYEIDVYNSLQSSSLGNMPENEDIYYLRLATINSNDTIDYGIRLFGEVISDQQLPENLEEVVEQNQEDIQALEDEDVNNAKLNKDNYFLNVNSFRRTDAVYNSGTQAVDLGDSAFCDLPVNGTLSIKSFSHKNLGAFIRVRLTGTGTAVLTHSNNLICPGNSNLVVQAGNWIEIMETNTNIWEVISNSTSNTAILKNVSSIPTGSIIAYDGSMADFDGTGLGTSANTQGWAICNGNNGTNDLRGRSIVGLSDIDPEYSSLGSTGGNNEITLSINQLPVFTPTGTITMNPHFHSMKVKPGVMGQPSYTDYSNSGGSGEGGRRTMDSGTDQNARTENATSTGSISMDSIGGGAEIDIRNPYYVAAWIKRIG